MMAVTQAGLNNLGLGLRNYKLLQYFIIQYDASMIIQIDGGRRIWFIHGMIDSLSGMKCHDPELGEVIGGNWVIWPNIF